LAGRHAAFCSPAGYKRVDADGVGVLRARAGYLFRFGDPLGFIEIRLINEEGLDYFIVQRRLFPNVIHHNLQARADLFAWTLFDAGGLIDRLQCLTFRRL